MSLKPHYLFCMWDFVAFFLVKLLYIDGKSSNIKLAYIICWWGDWLAQAVEHVIDLGIMSLSPILGVEITENANKCITLFFSVFIFLYIMKINCQNFLKNIMQCSNLPQVFNFIRSSTRDVTEDTDL